MSNQKNKKNIAEIYPLSPMQQGMLFHNLYESESGVYFEQMSMDLKGDINLNAFKYAWQKVLDRYSILRTFFVWENRKTPLQIVLKKVELPWQNLDWRSLDFPEQQQQLKHLLQTEKEQGFDFNQAPLMNCTLVRLGDNDYKFIWSNHHILMDGWCLPIIFKDVLSFYEAQLQGVTCQLPTPRPYSNYINWLNSQDKEAATQFWQKNLQGFTAPTPLIIDKTISQLQHHSGDFDEIECVCSADCTQKLGNIAQKYRVTLSTIVQAAWALLLSRYSSESDVVFGVTVSGRPPDLPGVENMVGLFINTLPLRVKVSSSSQLISWLQEIQQSMAELQQYSYTPLFDIQAKSEVGGGISLFESIVVFENYPLDSSLSTQKYSIEVSNSESFERTNYPLTIVAVPGDELLLRIIYDTARFDEDTIERMTAHLQNLLEGIAENPTQKVGEITLLSESERHQLLFEWNDTATEYQSDKCIHFLFEEQVEKTPDTVALRLGEEQLTYKQLNQRANQLAHHLQSLGVKPEMLVGICVERSMEMIIGLLGILKAGGAYVPLDPNYPSERLSYTLRDSGIGVLVTQSSLKESLPDHNAQVVCLDSDEIEQQSQENPDSGVSSDNLAYVIYTSGSTGKPKGVLVEHNNVIRLLKATESWYNFNANDVWTNFHSIAFDFSVWEIWGALSYGGRLVIVPYWISRDTESFYELLCQEKVTVLNQTPSAFGQLIEVDKFKNKQAQLNLRLVIFGGEALSLNSLQPWFEEHGDSHPQLVNMYGITETTVHVTYRPITMADLNSSGSLIGCPISDLQMYILDDNLQPVPIGIPGQMYVGGAGVTRGYLNRSSLTNERFIPNPFNDQPQQRLYKTGDLARYLPNGDIEYLGRIDNQVKIRGFRIELGEIEAVINKHPSIRESVVTIQQHESDRKRLAAYLIPDQKQATPVLQLVRLREQGRLLDKSLYELPNGSTIAYLNKNETDFVYQEIFEQESYLHHGITINDGDCIFDVGANIGLFSLFAAKTCCNLEVYAFEPIPPIFELLRLNTEIHSLNVKLFNIGLATETKQDTFTYYPNVSVISGRFADALEEQKVITSFLLNQDSSDETTLSPVGIKQLLTERLESEQFTCQLKTISEVIEENNVKQIDLLKIDVEKSELEVLKGIKEEDWQKINQIVVEVHNYDNRLAEITQLLDVHGYKYIVVQETELRETELYNIYAVRKSFERISRKTQNVVSHQKPIWNSQNALIKDIRHYLKAELPEFMIPYSFVILDRLPLTANGKIDLKALPAPDREISREDEYVAARTDIEKTLTNIWSELLPVNKVSIHDNFFEIGGDSILSIQVISRAKNAGILLTTKQIFQHQTIAELATIANTTISSDSKQGIVTGVAPLTPIQHWFFAEQTEELHHYNQSVLLKIPHNIKTQLLEKALEKVTEHHDALRLSFNLIESEYQQTNQGIENKIPLTVIDLSEYSTKEQPQEIERIATEYQGSLNLATGQIIQVVMFNLGEKVEDRLLIIIHHLAVDGVSWRILLEDLENVYQQLVNEQPLKLAPKTTAFIDWATKLKNYAQSEIIQQEVDYWENQPWSETTSLPLDYPGNQQQNTVDSAVNISVKLNAEETSILLGSTNEAYNTQINDILLSALSISLFKWTRNSKVLIDLEGHGREEILEDVDLSATVGWFTSLFPVLLQVPEDKQIASVIKSIKEQLRAIPNRGIGFGILRYLSSPEIAEKVKLISTPEISFNYLGQFDQIQSETGWKLAQESTGSNHSSKHIRSHLLDINALVVEGELEIAWTYSSNIHSQNTIENLAENYLQAIRSILEYCQLKEHRGYTPSDFPLAQLNQVDIDELLTPIKTKISAIYPLSPMQQGMLFHSIYEPGSGFYFEQMSMDLTRDINAKAFEIAWQKVVDRYSVLRTFFVWENRKTPLQIVLKEVLLPWQNLDWRKLDFSEQQQQLKHLLQTQKEQSFDFNQAPLMHCTLIRLGDDNYKFIWSHHHILIDGWCLSIIFKDVLSFYEAQLQDVTCQLPASRPYSDYIAWLNAQDKEAATQFWQKTLQGFTAPNPLVVDKTISQSQQNSGDYHEIACALSADCTQKLGTIAQQYRVTLSTIVQAAWALLLSRYSSESDIVFGVTVSGRPPISGVEDMVGLFINTLPLRVKVSGSSQLTSWLQEIQESMVELQQYSYTSLADIQAKSEVGSGISLFESIVVFENYPIDSSLLNQESSLEVSNIEGFERTNYPLNIVAVPGDELLVEIGYDIARFDENTIERMTAHLQNLLEGIAKNPDQKLSEITLLSESEKHQLLVEWNDSRTEYPSDKCIHFLFEKQVEKNPDVVAVVFEDEQLTYQQLNQRANQLAHHLQTLGVKPEVLVGICVERSIEMIVGMLGILKAGGAYVPLDPNYPQERLNYMLRDSAVGVLVTQSSLLESLPEHNAQVVCLDSDEIEQYSQDNFVTRVASNNLAYVIYTSGSTGKPKGVQICHQNLVNLCHGISHEYALTYKDRVLQFASISFDVALEEIFPTLLSGATLILKPVGLSLEFEDFSRFIEQENLSVLNLPAAYWNAWVLDLSQEQGNISRDLRLVIVGSDQVFSETMVAWHKLVGNRVELRNAYGVTEAAITTTVYNPSNSLESLNRKLAPIGKPIANTQVYLLDHHLQPVPIGIPGELYLGGAGVARGYLNRPELTKDKFITNPFNNDPSEGLYKTGDLARYLSDGNIEFLGRIDNQVKIRGFRIELGEIEAALATQPQVQEVVVIATEEKTGSRSLVAYIVANEEITTQQLKAYIKERLPGYMVPSAFVILESLPLTPNGKIDRKALPAVDIEEQDNEYVAPRTDTEKILTEIWSKLLPVKRVSIHDNFFEIGGDSILSIQVISRAKNAGIQITAKQIFQHQTIAELATVVNTEVSSSSDCKQGIVTGVAPLTPIQHSFFEEQTEELHHFNQSVLLKIPHNIKPQLLEKALDKLLEHHDALRLSFNLVKSEYQQTNQGIEHKVPLTVIDLSEYSTEEQPQEIERIATEYQGSLNLEIGQIIQVVMFNLGKKVEGRLLIIIHHLAVDGVSWRILLEDLENIYQQLVNEQPLKLAPKTTAFIDWATKLKNYAQSEIIQQELDYWVNQLWSETTSLPLDYPDNQQHNTVGSAVNITVKLNTEETSILLGSINEAYNTQINDILLSALSITLREWTRNSKVLIDLEGHGREEILEDVDLSATVGWFTSLFPVLLQVPEDKQIESVIKSVKEQLRAIPNRGIGFGILRYLSSPKIAEKIQAIPTPEIVFNYLGQFDQVQSETGWKLAVESTGDNYSSKHNREHILDINALVVEGELQITWTYSSNIHNHNTVENLAENYLQAIRSIVEYCQLEEHRGYTPSDFPLAQLNQLELDELLAKQENKNIDSIYPLSPSQQGMLFETLFSFNKGIHIEQFILNLQTELDLLAFEKAWHRIVRKYSLLRTAFIWENRNEPLQIVFKEVQFKLEQQDWRGFSPSQQQEKLQTYLKQDRLRGFQMNTAPLIRGVLMQVEENTYQFIFTSHHILMDGWSFSLILDEVFALYKAFSTGKDLSFQLSYPYRDYIAWLKQQDLSQAEMFWQKQLQGFVNPTPLGNIVQPIGVSQLEDNYGQQEASLSASTTAALQSKVRQHGLTLNTLVQGVWALLLSRYSSLEDVVFGATVSGRPPDLPGVESMVGLFINTVPTRFQVSPEASFWSWLQDIQSQNLQKREYEYCSQGQIHQWSDVPSSLPLYESILVFENYPVDSSALQHQNLNINFLEVDSVGAQTNYPIRK